MVRAYAIKRLLGLAVSAALGASFMTFLSIDRAGASHDCPSGFNVIGSPDTNGRGVRTANPGMRISNSSVSCARASAIAVVNASETRAVEVGWYEEPVNITPCPQTSGNPKVLEAWIINGVFNCDQGAATISGPFPDDETFRIHDNNQDGIWQYFFGNTNLGTHNMGTFITGDPRALGERKSTHDSSYANFDQLYRMNASQAWTSWTGTSVIQDLDPDYRGCIYGQVHYEVKLGSC